MTADRETAMPEQKPISLLLVDDEPAVLNTLERLLRGDPYQIHRAETGAQAISLLEQTRIDVVVSDIRMPGMSGTELFARIAASWPDTSRIALTGVADIADAVAAINSGGIFRWVPKPWDSQALRRTLHEAAERVRKIQATRRRLQIASRRDGDQQTLPHAIKKFFKGELIFTEGSPGHQVHFIRAGKVELSIERDGRRIVLDTRRAGDCFGVVAAILKTERTVTAIATEFTETFSVSHTVVEALLRQNDALLTSMVRSLAEQSRRTLLDLGRRDPVVNPIDSAACALDLMARAAMPKNAVSSAKAQSQTVALAHQEVVQTLGTITGMVKSSVFALLEQMAGLNLVAIDSARQVHVRPGEILVMAKKLSAGHGDTLFAGLRAEAELMDLDEMSDMLGVECALIQDKLVRGELPQALWAFRKSQTLRLVHEKGREFFTRPAARTPGGGGLGDLMGVDRDTLGRALSRMDIDRLAALLKAQRQDLQELMLGALSKRLRTAVVETMAEIRDLDAAELLALEHDAIARIEAVKSGGETAPDKAGTPRR